MNSRATLDERAVTLEWCPLCQAATAMLETDEDDESPQYRVACQECRLQTCWCVSPENAVSRWNTRAARPLSASGDTKELERVARKLLERWDGFKSSDANQQEAYYHLAKNAWGEWEELRAALEGNVDFT